LGDAIVRKSAAEAAETRKKIVEEAAKAFKRKGIEATGVAEIMAAAGLTHGGFYRHFESKEQLVAEACASSMETLVEAAKATAEGGDASFMKHLKAFLSAEYRDDCIGGCPLVAMGSELVRADGPTRRGASDGFMRIIDIMAKFSRAQTPQEARAEAMFTLSSMIGAVTMARILDDPKVSDQVLEAARKRLIGPAKDQKKTKARAA
jgi:TetR/AcrR family transcriptional repressor of nem operon